MGEDSIAVSHLRLGNRLTGVDFKQPEIIRIVLLRAESSFLV